MADDRDPTSAAPAETSWADYYQHTLGRELRPPFVRGIQVLQEAGVRPGQAIEVGFGDGEETLALLAAGGGCWRSMRRRRPPRSSRPRVPGELADRLEIRSTPVEDAELPPFDLLYAGYTLPFLAPEAFDRFWAQTLDHANPGGYLVVNLFGTHDTWAGRPDMRFHERAQVERLVDGLDIVVLDETEEDGPSFLGPKHWHVFDVIVRKPTESG